MSLSENLDNYDFRETKRKVNDYFSDYETLKWQQARLELEYKTPEKVGAKC